MASAKSIVLEEVVGGNIQLPRLEKTRRRN